LRAEALLDRAVSQTTADLYALSAAIRAAEHRGLSDAERVELQARFEPLAVTAGALADVEGRLDESGLELDAFIDLVSSEVPADSLSRRTWDWVKVWAADPDLIRGEDEVKLRRFWAARVVGLLRRFDALGRMLSDESAIEQGLDEAVLRVASWLATEYKQPTPA